MNDFWNELIETDIHARDYFQFELKTEFELNPSSPATVFQQDFYLFIPESLHINNQTYSKEQFYLDETNLIRYKTPSFSFRELINLNNPKSPLARLNAVKCNLSKGKIFWASDEVKLFGNIFRSTLRDHILEIIAEIKQQRPDVKQHLQHLCSSITETRNLFLSLYQDYAQNQRLFELCQEFVHVDEFVGHTLYHYLTGLLKILRQYKDSSYQEEEQAICDILLKEKHHLDKLLPSTSENQGKLESEFILHRLHLLNKFMLDPLLLKTKRRSLVERHSYLLGAFAAGLAMFVYMILFVWKISTFAIDSFPFIVFAVLFYILKDRLKEGIKTFYFRQATLWFPDYSTHITDEKGYKVGDLTESMSFIEEPDIPEDVLDLRHAGPPQELRDLKRRETVIHYKRTVSLNHQLAQAETRRKGLTLTFRFNIHHFLDKAADPLQPFLKFNTDTLELSEIWLPKVYHLNIVIRNTHEQAAKQLDLHKFRIIIDKTGIKRVEHV